MKPIKNSCLSFCLILVLSSCGGVNLTNIDLGKVIQSTTDIFDSKGMSGDERMAVGLDMTALILGASEIHPNKALQQYVNQVGSWLALHSNLVVDGKRFQDCRY